MSLEFYKSQSPNEDGDRRYALQVQVFTVPVSFLSSLSSPRVVITNPTTHLRTRPYSGLVVLQNEPYPQIGHSITFTPMFDSHNTVHTSGVEEVGTVVTKRKPHSRDTPQAKGIKKHEGGTLNM